MLYTNYKQIARLTLKSNDAVKTIVGTPLIDALLTPVTSLYTFKPNLPFLKFTKNTRMSVESFIFNHLIDANGDQNMGDVFIKNIKKPNVYHSSLSRQNGTCIFSGNFHKDIDYKNNEIFKNSIDITGATGFLEGNELNILVDTGILSDGSADVNCCIDAHNWSLTLVIFKEEKKENDKDFVKDSSHPYSHPSLY